MTDYQEKAGAFPTVLLIQDDMVTAKLIMDWLAEHASVTHVSQKDQIIKMIHDHNWDLIITNIDLPNLNDLDITNLVKSTSPDTSILIVTQHQKIEFILDAMQRHADGLEFKPLEKNKFVTLALKLIKAAQTRQVQDRKVVLAIGAHPDDVELGCGGTLSLHLSKGNEIHILTLSHGASGGDPELRKQEAEEAAKFQGAHLHLENLSDTNISEGVETISVIEKLVQKINPTYVYCHSIHDTHKDHRNVHQATLSACRHIPNLYCYQSPSSSVDFKPNQFIDISGEFLETKLKAIACFKSQCELRPYLDEDLLRSTARYWGRYCNYRLAEPMEVIRQKS